VRLNYAKGRCYPERSIKGSEDLDPPTLPPGETTTRRTHLLCLPLVPLKRVRGERPQLADAALEVGLAGQERRAAGGQDLHRARLDGR
jgi:hypothetical protein